MTPFGIDDQTTIKEVTGHLDTGIHNTTGVVTDVQNNTFDLTFFER